MKLLLQLALLWTTLISVRLMRIVLEHGFF
jgi:hypothetical protein